MKYPKFLNPNGRIGFIAPSFGCSLPRYAAAFDNAVAKLEKLGYTAVKGPNCYAGEGIGISNKPDKCAAEFESFYTSKDTDVLFSCGGGELMCDILDYIDFEKIKAADPKWFMGYSDNTNLTFLLATLCDTAALYASNAPEFGMEPWHKALYDTLDCITGKKSEFTGYEKWEKESLKSELNPLASFNVTEDTRPVARVPESMAHTISGDSGNVNFKGRLLGGCLDCIVSFVGTKYDKVAEFNEKYGDEGIVWFLEACDLNVFSIKRALVQMERAGWFEKASGFVFGRPILSDEMMGLDHFEAVMSVVGKYNVPVIMDVDLGHMKPTMPFVCGAKAEISLENPSDAAGTDFKIKYEYR